MARDAAQDLGDGPVVKPGRDPIERPEPRPKPPAGGGSTPPPAPPRPAPRPTTPEPPVEEPPGRGPVIKPQRPPKEVPLPTTLSGPIGARWRALGGLNWGQPTSEPERLGGGQAATFRLPDGRFASILWRSSTGALLVTPTLSSAYHRQRAARGPLGFPRTEELRTHDNVGRYQVFDGGLVVWHPSTGAATVFGAINTAYGAAGGSAYGYPLAEQAPMPDGRGWVQEFRDVAGGGDRSILWTPEHGAHPLYGAIRAAWRSYRGEASIGYPITGEMDAAGGGRWQQFEGADYIWRADTGAHEVHGSIAGRYHQLGGSTWGYPTTDETKTPDGTGRYNHFRGPGGDDRSIYWTPDTGAQPVVGAIRQRWAAMRWERSSLGYPVAEAGAWSTPGDSGGSRQQRFQRGQIFWRDNDGLTFVDPVELVASVPGGSGFGGEARVKLHGDGTIEWFGEVTNSAYQDYDYRIYAVVQAPADGALPPIALALSKTGEINMQVVGTNKNRWHEQTVNPAVGPNYAQLAQATLQVHSQFKGGITSKLDDILTTIGAWTFTAAVGPLGLGLIYAGVEMGALVSGGNFPSGPRIIAGTLWMHGPGGMMFGFVVDELTKIGQRRRGLTEDEIRLLDIVFAGAIDPRTITLTDTAGKGGRAFAFPGAGPAPDFELNMAEHYRNAGEVDFVKDNIDDHGISKVGTKRNPYAKKLVHEAVHAWQYRYMTNATSYVLHGMFDSTYEPKTGGTPWSKQNIEQQATLVERWVRDHFRPETRATDADMGLRAHAALADPMFTYAIGPVRAGRV